MASSRMATPSFSGAGWTGAELFAAAQGAGIAALTSLQQENAQLRTKVALLESSLRQALEELEAMREERQVQGGYPAPLPVEVCEVDAGLPTKLDLPFIAPPPGLPIPTSLPASPLGSGRRAAPVVVTPPAAAPRHSGRGSPGLLEIPSAVQHDESAMSLTPTYPSPSLTPSSSADGFSEDGPRDTPLRVVPAPGILGTAGTIVEWRVECLHVKLKANCGFPLLSPMFSLGDLSGLRLMFVPGATWAARQAKAGRKPQNRRKAAGAEGPNHGALKLKALSPGDAAPLRFFLVVGGRRQGPCCCDFSEHAIQGCNLDFDWLEQMDREADCLQLRLEFV